MKASHWSMLSSSTAARKDIPCTCSPGRKDEGDGLLGQEKAANCRHRSPSVISSIKIRFVMTYISHIWSVAGIRTEDVMQLLVHDTSLRVGQREGVEGRGTE